MKKWWICLPLLLLLAGCGGPEDYETVADQYLEIPQPQASRISIVLPEDASVMALSNEGAGSLYLCDGYGVAVQTMSAGDLDATLQSVTGYSRRDLQIYETQQQGVKRYACVWAAAGEGGDQIGKAVILDDGRYHYAVTILAPADRAGEWEDTWQRIFGSIELE